MSPSPDLPGFRDATIRMRAEMGTDVAFFAPQAETYPAGTPLDPETGKPFDPVIQATASGFTSAAVRAGLYTKPVPSSREDDAIANAVGWFEAGNIVLDVDINDEDLIADATEVEVRGERYAIADSDRDGVGDVEHRVLVFARQM